MKWQLWIALEFSLNFFLKFIKPVIFKFIEKLLMWNLKMNPLTTMFSSFLSWKLSSIGKAFKWRFHLTHLRTPMALSMKLSVLSFGPLWLHWQNWTVDYFQQNNSYTVQVNLVNLSVWKFIIQNQFWSFFAILMIKFEKTIRNTLSV